MDERDSPSTHIQKSLSLLEEQEKEFLGVTDSALLKDHNLSIKLGLRFLDLFLSVSSNEDLKTRIINVVYSVTQILHSLSNTPTDGSVIPDNVYTDLREKMKNLVIKQETGEYDVIFQQIFNWFGHFKKTNGFLLECLGELSSCKADPIAPFVKELEELREKLLFLQALLTYVADAGVHVKEKNKKFLSPFAAFLDKATCLLFSCSIDKMDENMALAMKHMLSNLLEEIKVKEIYKVVLRASELCKSTESPLESELYLLDILIYLLNSFARSGIYLNDLSEKIHDKLKSLGTFLADLPHEQKIEKSNYLVMAIEAITWKSIPVLYSCYNEKLNEDTGKEVNGALSELLDQIDHIPAEVREMKLYNYPKTDELGFLDLFLGHLEELLTYRPELIEILREQIEKLYMEFGFLRSFLRIIKAQLNEHEELEDLWTRIIHLAYQAEHVIDFYLVKYASDSRIMLSLSGIIEQTMIIKSEVERIYDEKKYHTQAHEVAKTFVHVSEKATDITTTEMVGFKEEADMIEKYLFGSQKELNVVLLVGLPGIGKTTLSKKIYEDHSIVNYFYVRAWCSVPQTYQRRELLLSILGDVIKVTEDINKLNDKKLAEKLYNSLNGRRYLIVIDDLWDSKAWDDLQESLPDDNVGSRILVTSRFQDVASKTKAVSFVHVLRPLTNDESWELFQKKLFQKGNFFKEFWEVGKQILEKCVGLPLAIVLVVGLLKMVDERLLEWNKIAESLSSQVSSDSKNPMEVILELSYNYLSDHLKSCFLYFGAFVEDKEISVWKLKQLWIAEGFVREIEAKSLEDVAEEYLMDLISRNLVTATKERSLGGVKSCDVHDVLREFCLKKAKEESFLHAISVDHWSKFSRVYHQRRFSIYSKADDLMKAKPSGYNVRTLLYTAAKERSFYLDISFISQNFKLVRVLDLSCINIGKSIDRIGLLNHLRYLAVKSATSSIPSSIAKLWNLQFFLFYANDDTVVRVRDSLWDMVNLRHVYIHPGAYFDVDPDRLEKSSLLDKLETLSTPHFKSTQDAEKLLRRLPKLRKLSCVLQGITGGEFPIIFDFLDQLMSLKVTLGKSLRGPRRCEFRFPVNLQKFTLIDFELLQAKISKFGMTLPNLKVLKLIGVKFGPAWIVNDGNFPKLKYLKLSNLRDMTKWNVSEDSFPVIEHLVLDDCWSLEEIPYPFGDIPTMRTIIVKNCGPSVHNSARRIQWHKWHLQNTELKVYTYGNVLESMRKIGEHITPISEDIKFARNRQVGSRPRWNFEFDF